MILGSFAVAGTLAVGIQVYREQNRLKNIMTTYIAQKLDTKPKKKLVEMLLQHPQAPLHDSSQTQIRRMGIALSSLGLATGGLLFYPPLALLSVPGVLYITRLTFLRAWNSVSQKRQITVDVISTMNRSLLLLTGNFFFASVSASIFVFNRYLLGIIKDDSKQKIIDVFRHQSRYVWVEANGTEIQVPIDELEAGDVIVVNAGEIIPVDGQITAGMATVDQHLLTGEAQPIDKMPGESVWAMTILLSGRIYIQVEHTGEKSAATQIAQLLDKTIDSKTGMQLWVENFTDKSVTPYMTLSMLALPILGPATAIAMLQSHFKYKGTIATSLSILSYLQLALESGLFVKDGRTFELLSRVDTVVFDKTGTLTHEQPHVGHVHVFADASKEQVLIWAAAAETKQSHPIAKAILQEAAKWELDIPVIEESNYRIGYGLCVQILNQSIHVGSARFMEVEQMVLDAKVTSLQAACHDLGHSLVFVAVNQQIVGAVELYPTIRPEVHTVIQELRQFGIDSIYIISGDHEMPTRHLAEQLSLDGYYAEKLPAQKAELIDELQHQGRTVCYIGDGINDAIALKKAAVSVSLRGASTIATDTAQVVLLNQDLSQLCQLFELARSQDANMKLALSAIVLPSVLTLYGSLFWGMGLAYAFLLPQMGLSISVLTALSPIIRHRMRHPFLSTDSSIYK